MQADDFALQTRTLGEEKDKWMQKALALEVNFKKSSEVRNSGMCVYVCFCGSCN
jgi:hypothetical protein